MRRNDPATMSGELRRAMFWKRTEKIKSLINLHRNDPAYLGARNRRGQSLFTWAIANRQFDIALLLTKCESLVIPAHELNLEINGYSLLGWMVAFAGNEPGDISNEVIGLLLDYKGLNVDIKIYGIPVLFLLLQSGNNDLLRMMLAHPTASTTRSTQHHTILTTAMKTGKRDLLHILLECDKVNVNMMQQGAGTALMVAVRQDSVEAVEMLLAHPKINLDLEYMGETALAMAAGIGNPVMVRLLLDKYGDTLKSSDPMVVKMVQTAAVNNKVDVVHLFIDRGLDKGVDLYTWAVDEKHEDIAKRLPVTENPPPRFKLPPKPKNTTAALTSRMGGGAANYSSGSIYSQDDANNTNNLLMMLAADTSYMSYDHGCPNDNHGGYDHGGGCDTGTSDYGGGCDSGGSTFTCGD